MRLDELIPGKWYDCSTWQKGTIAKYKSTELDGDRIFISESLEPSGLHKDYTKRPNFVIVSKRDSVFFEITQDLLDLRLPMGHSDTYPPKSNQDYDWCIGDEFMISQDNVMGSDLKTGVIYLVKDVRPGGCYAKKLNGESIQCNYVGFAYMISRKKSIKYLDFSELIDGNWYKFKWAARDNKIYGKFNRDASTKQYAYFLEGIWGSEFRKNDAYCPDKISELEWIDVKSEEIQKYLPTSHLDFVANMRYPKQKESDRTFLPDNWCLRVESGHTNYPEIYEWRITGSNSSGWRSPGYICSNRRHELNNDGLGKEISIDDFIRLVYNPFIRSRSKSKNSNTIPEKWAVKVDSGYKNYPIITDYRQKSNYGYGTVQWSNAGYILSVNLAWSKTLPSDYNEISRNDFNSLIYQPWQVKEKQKLRMKEIAENPLTPAECFKKEEKKIKTESTTNIVIPRLKKTRSIVVESTKNVTI